MSETRHQIRLAMLRLSGVVAVLLCVCGGVAGVVQVRAASTNDLPPLPVQRAASSAVRTALAARPATNAAVTLLWEWELTETNVATLISNLTLGTVYQVGTGSRITLGKQLAGSNTYQAFNSAGQVSGLATIVNAWPDSNVLSFAPYVFKADWRGRAGTLQTSSNQTVWWDVGPIASNGTVLITNNQKQGFYRVRP